MKGIFCDTSAATNEEYRRVIKSRMRNFIVLIILGAITAVVSFGLGYYLKDGINHQVLWSYSGLGTGLFAGGIMLWIKNKRLLSDEERLKESRLQNTDERIQEISKRALRLASYIMIIVLYAVALIGGIFYPILFKALMFVVCIFLLAYMISYKYYDSKM